MALTAAAIMVTTLSLVILGAVSMLVHVGNSIAGDMKQRVDEIRVYLVEEITDEEVKSLQKYLTDMQEVKAAEFISKDDAMEEYKEMFADQKEMLEQIDGNPLPASFRVRMTDPKHNNLVASRLQERPEISVDANNEKEIKNEKDVVDKVLRITSMVQKIGYVVVVAFCIVAIALVSITIRMAIYSRRKEIGIMKLVGATNWFIRWPFVMEGVIEGFAGSIVAIVVTVLLQSTLINKFADAAGIKSLVTTGYTAVLGLMLVAFGVLIGAIGSALALRKFMEV